MINYDYLRTGKASVLKKWHENNFLLRDDLICPCYDNATILPLKRFEGDNLLFGRGGVVDDNLNYVDISAINNRVQFAYDFSEIQYKDERIVYCGYLVNHWGHFLVEAVSRLWYFLKNDSTIDKYVFFLNYGEEREIKGNYKNFFELLGVWDKLEFINKPTKYKEVVVPELGYKWRTYYSQNYKDIFNAIAKNITVCDEWVTSEKIFFTRSQLKKSQETDIGVSMIDNYYENNGYKIISPEKVPLDELVYLIRNAKVVTTLSGSLPHNMLFAKDEQVLVIIERNVLNNEIQVDVNNIKRLNTTYIDANIGIYPVDLGSGPFIISYKGMLEKYTTDNDYMTPEKKYFSDKFYKYCFKKYMKQYNKIYRYKWFMYDWMINYTDYIYEAYKDSLNYFGDYIKGSKPFKFSQYFNWHYIKQMIKRILNRK
jgi:hypothetical protein